MRQAKFACTQSILGYILHACSNLKFLPCEQFIIILFFLTLSVSPNPGRPSHAQAPTKLVNPLLEQFGSTKTKAPKIRWESSKEKVGRIVHLKKDEAVRNFNA